MNMIYLKSAKEIEMIRSCCQIVGQLLDALAEIVVPGVSTLQINDFADEFIRSRGATPSFKGYQVPGFPPYPAAVCTSINSAIVHGIPRAEHILQEGDIMGIDVGVYRDGYHGDAARTYAVGIINRAAERLIEVTRESLRLGINQAVPGNRVGDISHAIGSYVMANGYYVADYLTGHGIGKTLHEEPVIPNTGIAGKGPRLQAGMTLAIEPMVNVGTNRVREDGWEYFVADASLSAHFEHTILITETEPLILSIA